MAYWHQPRWTATASNNSHVHCRGGTCSTSYHADVVLNGHIHTYARFAPLNPSGAVDSTNGIREVIVGTGGESLQLAAPSANPNPARQLSRSFGYLRMVLHPTGYDAQFINSAGAVKDSFSGTCHGSTAPSTPLTVSQSVARERRRRTRAPTYTVTVHNPGTTDQTNVDLTDTPPANAQNISALAVDRAPARARARSSATSARWRPARRRRSTVQATPIQPPTAVNTASAQSDQTSMVNNSADGQCHRRAPATSYVGDHEPRASGARRRRSRSGTPCSGASSAPARTARPTRRAASGSSPTPGSSRRWPSARRCSGGRRLHVHRHRDEQHDQVRRAAEATARDRIDAHDVHAHLGRRGPPAGYARGHPGRVPGDDDVGGLLARRPATSGTFVAQQGHRQVQVPRPAAQH